MTQTLTTRVFVHGGRLFSRHIIEVPFTIDIVPIDNQVGIRKFDGFGARFLIPVR